MQAPRRSKRTTKGQPPARYQHNSCLQKAGSNVDHYALSMDGLSTSSSETDDHDRTVVAALSGAPDTPDGDRESDDEQVKQSLGDTSGSQSAESPNQHLAAIIRLNQRVEEMSREAEAREQELRREVGERLRAERVLAEYKLMVSKAARASQSTQALGGAMPSTTTQPRSASTPITEAPNTPGASARVIGESVGSAYSAAMQRILNATSQLAIYSQASLPPSISAQTGAHMEISATRASIIHSHAAATSSQTTAFVPQALSTSIAHMQPYVGPNPAQLVRPSGPLFAAPWERVRAASSTAAYSSAPWSGAHAGLRPSSLGGLASFAPAYQTTYAHTRPRTSTHSFTPISSAFGAHLSTGTESVTAAYSQQPSMFAAPSAAAQSTPMMATTHASFPQVNFAEPSSAEYFQPLPPPHPHHHSAYAEPQRMEVGQGYQRRYEQRRLYDLPQFSGRPEEWPMFVSSYHHTTDAYGYTQLDNLTRLQKSLEGEAKRAVECLLIHPQHVDVAMGRLEALFGRPEQLVRSQIRRARELPYITEEHIVDLISFATSVQNLALFLDTPATQYHLADPTLLEELVSKLPMGRRITWAAESAYLGHYPTIMDFARWVTATADLIGQVMFDADQPTHTSRHPNKAANKRHVLVSVERETASQRSECVFCSGSHDIERCADFSQLAVADRWVEVRKRGICFGCLVEGHILPGCERKRKCGLDGCTLYHHRKLHSARKADQSAAKSTSNSKAPPAEKSAHQQHASPHPKPDVQPTAQTAQDAAAPDISASSRENSMPAINHCREMEAKSTLFRVVPVTVHGPHGDASTFALLDEGSSITLIDAALADQVGLSGPKSKLNVQWFSSDATERDSMRVSFGITGQQSGCSRHNLQNVRTVRQMDLPSQTVNAAALVQRCPHLLEIPVVDYEDAKPKILIGLDHHYLGVPSEIRTDPDRRSLVAAKTPLGWVLYGSDGPAPQARPSILHIRDAEDDRYELLNQLVLSHFSTESFGTKVPGIALESVHMTRARSILAQTTRRIARDRFQTGLLWKSPVTRLPDSYGMALRRLRSVEARMHREPEFREQYKAQIAAYVQKGYARRLTDAEAGLRTSRTWFLPHFAVFNANKPGKFRLVFDAAAEVNGVSLNGELLTGPDDNNALLKLLMQFRVGEVGIVADIREMFHQVRIREEDQVAQRFLWRAGDSSVEPSVYTMTVMTFGATCSPASAQYIKNRNAAEFADEYPEAAAAIQSRHYVDDYVASYCNAEEAARITTDVIEVHRRGGFELRGFVSNSQRTMELLGLSTGSGDVVPVNLQLEATESEKVLGMCWSTSEDALQFRTRFVRVASDVLNGTRTPSKREILSVSMSLFDPYGLLADFTLEPKLIVQDLWRLKLDWDTPAPESLARRWESWRREVERTKLLRVPRCYSRFLLTSDDVQLHIFADASEVAFAAVAYWRVAHAEGIDVSFVLGRTRCAPLQTLSIPRLELQAALLATRLLTEIRETHSNIALKKVFLWSDSTTVLSWLQSDQRKYKPFVQVRVGEILEAAPPECWRWVPTLMNVADDATRIQRPVTFRPEGRWTRGPAWLRLSEDEWPARDAPSEPDAADRAAPEEVRRKFVGATFARRPLLDYERFSSFGRLCRVVALVMRFIANLRSGKLRRVTDPLDARETEMALMKLCRVVQSEAFSKEIATLRREDAIEKSSSLFSLRPYIEKDSLLRLDGRTDAANDDHLPFDTRRPILLPRDHRFTWLLVKDQHERSAHQLTNATIVAIRRRFWVPQVRTLLKSVQSQCMVCKRRNARPVPPVEGQLPADRLTPYVRPFSSTGLDYFGPVQVTVGRRREKRWVAVFTCLAIRAVHLEVAADLSTDACLVCVRNLCHLRGTPRRIRCDNGTNFVGARNTLAKEDGFLDAVVMQRELCTTGIQWVHNCPGNPEAGGVWERMVQAVKKILAVTLKEEAPRVETLRAHLLEAANMLNSRPLTHISISPGDNEALTPNHFLIGGPNASTMTGPTDAEPASVRKQWRICRELSRRFWVQWVEEYLPDLTRRGKHHPDRRELTIGDVVIVCDSSQPRGRWPLGRIESVVAGPDGRVRTAEVRTKDGVFRRPVARLAELDVGPDSD